MVTFRAKSYHNLVMVTLSKVTITEKIMVTQVMVTRVCTTLVWLLLDYGNFSSPVVSTMSLMMIPLMFQCMNKDAKDRR